jgi:hypothetical protein
MNDTLYIPSMLNSYFLDKLKKLPVAGVFSSYGERPEIVAYKIYGDVNMSWIIKAYNDITSPLDKAFDAGSTLRFPSLSSIEKLYATLNAKQRAAEQEGTD